VRLVGEEIFMSRVFKRGLFPVQGARGLARNVKRVYHVAAEQVTPRTQISVFLTHF